MEQLEKVIAAVEKYPDVAEVVEGELRLSILHIQAYQARLVEPMIAGATEMRVSKLRPFYSDL